MKSTLLVITAVFLTACNPPPTPSNDEIITQTKKCRAAGMVPKPIYGDLSGFVGIRCYPTRKEEEQ